MDHEEDNLIAQSDANLGSNLLGSDFEDTTDQNEHGVTRAPPTEPPESTLAYKIIKSFMVSNIFTFMGLASSIITPSIDDLRNQVGCNYEEFAHAFVFSSIGGLFGALIGGFLADRFQTHVDLLMGVELIVGALARAALPWAPNLTVLSALFAITGMSLGAANPTSNAHLIVIWGAQASSPMQLLHMGYGLGTIISPLLVEPFLAHPINGTNHNGSHHPEFFLSAERYQRFDAPWLSLPNEALSDLEPNTTYTESHIYKPYAAIASYGVLGGCILLLFYFIPSNWSKGQRLRVKEKTTTNQIFNPGECADGRVIYGFTMIGLLFALYVLNSGKEYTVSVFMYAVAVDSAFSFTPFQGSLLTMGFFAGYAGGRAVYSILGLCVSVQVLLLSEVIGMLAVHTCLAIIGLDAPLNYIILVCLSGFFAGPMVPSMMTWMDRYIKMTALAFASLSVGMSAGSFLFNWISGYIFQHRQPVDLYYLSLGCAIAEAVLIAIGQILGSIHGDRYKAMEQKQILQQNERNSQENDPCEVQVNGQTFRDTDTLIQ